LAKADAVARYSKGEAVSLLRQLSLSLILNHSAANGLNLCVMSQHMHVPIAPAEKCAQNPANDADNYRAPERTPKAIHMESDHNARHEKQQQAVQDENEKAERNENKRRTENQQKRANKRVENTQQKRGANQRRDSVITNSVDYRRGNHCGNRYGSPAKNEMFHANAFRLIYAAVDEERESTCEPSDER
jgi:hypothetical protein